MTTDPHIAALEAWHRRDPDDFHRAAAVTADVCTLCDTEGSAGTEAEDQP